ncbi:MULTISPECIES: hypothetical protein [unclassified Halomonas]|uniref:hypothetical protein n=1 Tax=unclassified Halomonas TaxID=2609666 RepID=UPI0006D994E0|nr:MULTISPECIES: hypothetical protein [unclassified Halomonas]KPQ20479.1 MAG: hypothetical protein HLUCCO06_03490 [Halomonas sp. HL-93]SBR46269.1 hypothetical protein GA0071314_0639 [Halomonas sp. HL-93]SNY98666.1 hypothetical protein SAMN04488142_3292 [Halomonas sp. hl-4]
MRWIHWIALGALIMLSGCAVTPTPEPRELVYQAPPEKTFRAAVGLMLEQGYVVRHADLSLRRAEGVLARWPGYRLVLDVSEVGSESYVSVSAWRGGQPLPPNRLDPWLVALQGRLGLAP